MGRTNTKKLVQGAMIAAIFGVFSILNTYTGSLFDIYLCFIMVIPLVWYGYHYDLKSNIIVCIVSMFVIAMMGLPFFIASSISSCGVGLYLGEGLKKRWKKEWILLGTFVILFVSNLLIFEVFAGLLGVDLISEVTMTYQELCQWIPMLAQRISLQFALSLIPLCLILMSAMEMYIIVMFCQLALTRFKVEFPGQFHLALMHMSPLLGIVISLATFISYLLLHQFHMNYLVIYYIYYLGVLILGLQGLSLVSFILIIKKKNWFILLAYVLIFIPYVNMIYVVLGLLDIFSDLRGNILYNSNNE